MLGSIDSAAIVAVSDMERAHDFYHGKLGLAVNGERDAEVAEYRTGNTGLVVYKSDYAGTNKANAVVWGVGDRIEAIVAHLSGKGVAFERYPDSGMDYADGIHSAGSFRAAWFKDPDGNILHINSM